MNTCPTCGRIDGATRPHLLFDSEELCPRGAPGDYPPDDLADLEGRDEWGPEESNSGDPGEWADEPDELPAPLPEMLPELPEPTAPKAKRGRKGRVSAEPSPIVEDLLTRVAGDAFQMFCPVESCRSEVTAVFDGERLVLAEHVHPKHLGRCGCVVVPRKHWPPELIRAALERAGEWMVGEASDPGLASLFEPMTNVAGPGAVLTRETLKAGDAALRADADRGGYIVDADFDPDAAPGSLKAIRDAMVARALADEVVFPLADPADIRPIGAPGLLDAHNAMLETALCEYLGGNPLPAWTTDDIACQPSPWKPDPIATPEPPPVAGTGDVWAEIIAVEPEPSLREVFAARRQFGIDKYGTPLQRGNGRDHNNDIDQELCDGVVYARAADRPATEAVLRDLLFHGEAYAEDVSNFGAALCGIYSALGVSDLTAAHQRIDALRQAEKGLEPVLAAAGEGSTAVGVARDVAQFKGRFADAGDRISRQGETIHRLREIVNETEQRVTVPEGWTALDEDGCDLADYRAQILDIDDCLNEVDPDNRARSEDDTTAGQVISILRRMVDGSEDLAAALQPTDAGVKATLVELGGNPPRAVFVADISRKTAQRLGKSPGLYGRVVVTLKGEPL